VASPQDPAYNCIAFAAGDTARVWDGAMVPLPGYFWPEGANRGDGIESLRAAYAALGYEPCADGSLEPGYDKVALYADAAGWTHAARQMADGRWASKLGQLEDIVHAEPEALSGGPYGEVRGFMGRHRTP